MAVLLNPKIQKVEGKMAEEKLLRKKADYLRLQTLFAFIEAAKNKGGNYHQLTSSGDYVICGRSSEKRCLLTFSSPEEPRKMLLNKKFLLKLKERDLVKVITLLLFLRSGAEYVFLNSKTS